MTSTPSSFCRYLPAVRSRGALPAIACSAAAADLLAGLPGLLWLAAPGENRPPYDLTARFDDLPRLFETRPATVPPPVGIEVNPRQRRYWQEALAGADSPRIAVAWTGAEPWPEGLLEIAGARFYTFLEPVPGMTPLSGEPFALDAAAALLEEFEMVVSDDNPVGHLAGTLGLPCWTMLGVAPDWRWLQARRDTPWYPSMRLVRQERLGDWSTPLAIVRREIERGLARNADRLAAAEAALADGQVRRAAALLTAGGRAWRGDVRLHRLLGALALAQGRLEDAARAFHRAVAAAPGDAAVHSAFAGVLAQLGAHSDRERMAARAVALDPASPEPRLRHADALEALGRSDEALAVYIDAHDLAPQDRAAAAALSSALLRRGNFDAGLPLLPTGPLPRAGLQAAEGAVVVLDAASDDIEAVWLLRYAPLLGAAERVLAAVRPGLQRLVAGQPGVDGALAAGQARPPGALVLPAAALPRLFGTTLETIPADIPYLRANEMLARHWRSRFARPARLRVGIAWGRPRAPGGDGAPVRHRGRGLFQPGDRGRLPHPGRAPQPGGPHRHLDPDHRCGRTGRRDLRARHRCRPGRPGGAYRRRARRAGGRAADPPGALALACRPRRQPVVSPVPPVPPAAPRRLGRPCGGACRSARTGRVRCRLTCEALIAAALLGHIGAGP